ncbi:hypothetical protein AYI68_g511 [Smittium mucronatum]|uniref:Uncharacterized protein n=1 Tax=Smittium mucronatum TaxID=133383 RepID=A0A1R0H897_9FUNG|nr:hypothetical protein AYI68_g511 [Smittium mucronatum]
MVHRDDEGVIEDFDFVSKRPRSDTNLDVLQLFKAPAKNPRIEEISISPVLNSEEIKIENKSEERKMDLDEDHTSHDTTQSDQISEKDFYKSKPKKNDYVELFKNLHLRRIIKENHNTPILSVLFNFSRQNVQESEASDTGKALNDNIHDDNREISNNTANQEASEFHPIYSSKNSDSFYGKYSKSVSDETDFCYNDNVLLSCSRNQVSIYDNEHCGDHLDIMSNYYVKDSK